MTMAEQVLRAPGELTQLVAKIAALPDDWHGAGTVGINVLQAILRHARDAGPIRHSAETGSGKTTLLFSHLSEHHTVFAVDAGGSISRVTESPLFNSASTVYVDGPTQLTLPRHVFEHQHQLVLIDGPHGYPFPDLEYFYLYPTVALGGLFLLDDLKIQTIRRMFEILSADAMFELIDVVDDNTAFFRRTEAPLIHPHSDSWWLQGYNRAFYEEITAPPPPAADSSVHSPSDPTSAPEPQSPS